MCNTTLIQRAEAFSMLRGTQVFTSPITPFAAPDVALEGQGACQSRVVYNTLQNTGEYKPHQGSSRHFTKKKERTEIVQLDVTKIKATATQI